MSSHQQCVLQLGVHLLGMRCPPTSNEYNSLVAINYERGVLLQQCVRYPGCRQLGQRQPPARKVHDSLVPIYYERDVLPLTMCTIARWPSTRKEMSSRQQYDRQPGGHQLAKRCLPASSCTIAWCPSTSKEMSSHHQCVRQPVGQQLAQSCLPASNVYDSLVAIYQERDAFLPPMCTIAWQPSTRKVMSSRQQSVRQPGGHQLRK